MHHAQRLLPASVAAILVCCSGSAMAEPAAIVEDVSAPVSDIQPMDVLEPGQKITLPDGAQLTLGYFQSCLREKITGGSVTIGAKKSTVTGGTLAKETVDCGGAAQIVTAKKGTQTAGAVFRKGTSARKKLPKPDWTLFGTSPVLRFSEASESIRIERLDRPGEKPVQLKVKGASLDTAKNGVRLRPGGLYALSSGKKRYVLKISPLAVPDAPLLSRLVPM